MKSAVKALIAVIGVFVSASSGAAVVPVDLTNWVAEGGANWNVDGSQNEFVTQTSNITSPSVFIDPNSSGINSIFSSTIRVNSDVRQDDDFIGFVLGFQSGELSNPNSEFYLIDWKRNSQTYRGDVATRGLAFSTVSGLTSFSDMWSHSDSVNEVARGNTLGNQRWNTDQDYSFDIIFTSSLIEVFVDDVLELSVTASDAGLSAFSDGATGFYNLSQPLVRYSNNTLTSNITANNVPAPGSVMLFGLFALVCAIRARKTL